MEKPIETERNTMYVFINDDRSGTLLVQYPLGDDELLDCDLYAARWAEAMGGDLAAPNGLIPYGCGDFRVTLMDSPGAVRCWESRSYLFAGEDDT